MRRADFNYELPEELIAQEPLAERSASRLLCLDGATGHVVDRRFRELPQLLQPGDLLVFNDTRVVPARLYGRKPSGGRVELLLERVLDDQHILAQLRASRTPAVGTRIALDGGATAELVGRRSDLFELALDQPALALLEAHGHVPLPPYIERADTARDRERYQTVFARSPGAVAAPTAGLHFDRGLLEALARRGIETAFVTLHVGAGTFQPIRADDLREHRMHSEFAIAGADACAAVARARDRGGRVIAVGSTAVRTLETAARAGKLAPYQGETALFVYPGFRFRVVEAMITNFHLPESTLLMLVCAFGGRDNVLAAYRHAVHERYRFFSYGDAMYLTPAPGALAEPTP